MRRGCCIAGKGGGGKVFFRDLDRGREKKERWNGGFRGTP